LRRGLQLDELDPVAERIVDEASAAARQLQSLDHHCAEISGAAENRLEIVDD
jgi:hypothetical protein